MTSTDDWAEMGKAVDRNLRLWQDGRCLLCETPLAEREPDEDLVNGMHAFCVASGALGHEVGACHCNPEMAQWTERQIAVEAGRRLRARRAKCEPR